jgi:hypothetical protein
MKNTYLWLAGIVAVLIVLVGSLIYWSQKYILNTSPSPTVTTTDSLAAPKIPGQPRVQEAFSSFNARLLGRITEISSTDGIKTAKVDLLENVKGEQNMENAAIADGVCTIEQVNKSECLNNPFYIRDLDKSLDLKIAPQVSIQMYAREPRGGMLVDEANQIYLEDVPISRFIEQYAQAGQTSYLYLIPFYFGIEGGEIVRIQEKYIP